MKCPECEVEMKCPCIICMFRFVDAPGVYWESRPDDIEACRNCGFAAHIDWWMDYEVEILRAVGKWPAPQVL